MEKAFDQHELCVQVHITTDIQLLHLSERDSTKKSCFTPGIPPNRTHLWQERTNHIVKTQSLHPSGMEITIGEVCRHKLQEKNK